MDLPPPDGPTSATVPPGDLEGDVLEDGRPLHVGERHVLEADGLRDARGRRRRPGRPGCPAAVDRYSVVRSTLAIESCSSVSCRTMRLMGW